MCGVAAVVGVRNAATTVRIGLLGLQHRGLGSAGVVARDNNHRLTKIGGLGLVREVLPPDAASSLAGTIAIGHVRYATTGELTEDNVGPLLKHDSKLSVAVAHNGNLTNYEELRDAQEQRGVAFASTTDTETIIHSILASNAFDRDAIFDALTQVVGAYSLLILTDNIMVAVRDPHGIRPLVLGRLGDGYVVASETCAITAMGGTTIREIEPGEAIVFNHEGMTSYRPFPQAQSARCSFEGIYFEEEDSLNLADGGTIKDYRFRLGQMLASDAPPPRRSNLVLVAIPNSGNAAGKGYADALGYPLIPAIERQEVERTFIATPEERVERARRKYRIRNDMVRGQVVVIIDDSVVRGTTTREIIRMLREAGAAEVHVRSASPEITWPCYYGIAMSTREELLAASRTNEQIAEVIGADSIGYLRVRSLERSSKVPRCMACFTGGYPIPVPRTRSDLVTVDI